MLYKNLYTRKKLFNAGRGFFSALLSSATLVTFFSAKIALEHRWNFMMIRGVTLFYCLEIKQCFQTDARFVTIDEKFRDRLIGRCHRDSWEVGWPDVDVSLSRHVLRERLRWSPTTH